VLDQTTRTQLIGELVEVVATLANAQLDGFTTRLAQALQEAGAKLSHPVQRKLHESAAALVRKNRYPFSYVAAERLRMSLEHELQAAARGLAQAGEASGALKSLPPDVEVDKKLSLGKAGRVLEELHAERLTVLELRLASLFGRAALAPAAHPLRPQIFLNVLHEAWCEFHPDVTAHALVFPLLGPSLSLDLAPILHGANTMLAKRGILPQLQGAATQGSAASSVAAAGEDALSARLRSLLGDAGDAGASNALPMGSDFPTLLEPHALGRTALLDYLESLQKNMFDQHLAACGAGGAQSALVLAHVRRHAPRDCMSAADEKIIELLSAIFDAALAETALPSELRTLLASLQLPVLKAALMDRAFFFRADQPARRAIELLTEMAVGCDPQKGHTDPTYMTIRRNIERIQRGAAERSSVFADAVWDMESFLQREQTAADQILATPIAQALQQEKRTQAEKRARHEVALRLDTGEVTAFVEAFLEDRWVPVLTLNYIEQEQQPQAADEALGTMDKLIWSVKPKITAAERKELLGLLPRLVADLNRWLDMIQWHGAERARFFTELATCHASLVRAPVELSPQRQAELALQAARQAAERRLQRQAARGVPREPDEADRCVQNLKAGAWIEFEAGDLAHARRLKLAWVSPQRNLYLFATASRLHALTLTDEALAAILRESRAQVVDMGGFVERVLARTLGIAHPANGEQQRLSA